MRRNYYFLFCSLIFFSSNAQLKTAEGDHYLFTEFSPGIVLLKTGKEDHKLLNYNSLSEELVFKNGGEMLAVPPEQLARIDTVFIKERRFVILNNKFVELLHRSGWVLYVEHKCTLREHGKDAGYGGRSQTSAINTPSAVRLEGVVYNLKLPDGFETKRYSVYWLKKDGPPRPFSSLKQLKKFYKGKGSAMDDYLEKHDVEYEDQEIIVQLINHLESN